MRIRNHILPLPPPTLLCSARSSLSLLRFPAAFSLASRAKLYICMPLYTRTHARTPAPTHCWLGAWTSGRMAKAKAEWEKTKTREREPNELESNRKKELELELGLELVYQGKRDGPSERAIESQ